ncbi:MAG: amidohydrolase [Gemmatimonadota bacterium]
MRPTATLIAMAATVASCAAPRNAPDLVLVNGKVITVDSLDRVAEAVAVKDGRIVAVGPTESIDSLVGPQTERIDLGGLTMTPGLLDAHAHFAGAGVDRLFVLDLSYPKVTSIRDVLDSVDARIRNLPAGSWVYGRGWDEGKFTERRLITAADLDRVAPDHPVWLSQTMGHYGVANSVALRLAKIDRTTGDPVGGTIDRSANGDPTGILKESAQGLVSRLLPEETADQIDAGIRDLAKAFNGEGMTGVKDPGVSSEVWDAYKRVQASGDLTVRVFALWRGGRSIEGAQRLIAERGASTKPYETTGDDHVVAGGVKLYIDGSGGARTAWLYDDWNKNFTGTDRGNRGYPASNPDTVRQLIRLFHDAGMHVSTHSIGDRGIDWTVDSYAQVMRENPKLGLRHGIIHANIPTDRAIDTIARLQREFDAAYPEPSATFMWWIGDTYAGNFGPRRARRLNPFKTFTSKGIRWANGSDYGVTPFPARYGIWAAVARQPLLGVHPGDPYGREEAVDVRTALRAVTIWAARQMFLEKKIGSIEPGKYADLAVWDRDLYSVPTDSLKEMRALLTVFNGRVVHRAGRFQLQR